MNGQMGSEGGMMQCVNHTTTPQRHIVAMALQSAGTHRQLLCIASEL